MRIMNKSLDNIREEVGWHIGLYVSKTENVWTGSACVMVRLAMCIVQRLMGERSLAWSIRTTPWRG